MASARADQNARIGTTVNRSRRNVRSHQTPSEEEARHNAIFKQVKPPVRPVCAFFDEEPQPESSINCFTSRDNYDYDTLRLPVKEKDAVKVKEVVKGKDAVKKKEVPAVAKNKTDCNELELIAPEDKQELQALMDDEDQEVELLTLTHDQKAKEVELVTIDEEGELETNEEEWEALALAQLARQDKKIEVVTLEDEMDGPSKVPSAELDSVSGKPISNDGCSKLKENGGKRWEVEFTKEELEKSWVFLKEGERRLAEWNNFTNTWSFYTYKANIATKQNQ